MKKLIVVAAMATVMMISGCNDGNTADQERISQLESEIAALQEENSRIESSSSNAAAVTTTIQTTTTTTTASSTETIESAPTVIIPENPNFRNTVWGMTKEDVKQLETLDIVDENDNVLVCEPTSITNLNAVTVYMFDDFGKLYKAFYSFEENHTSENLYISDYNSIVKSLTQKYGEPEWSERFWYDDLYEDRPDDWGFAISIGDVDFVTSWDTEETTVWILMKGDNYNIQTTLYYESKTYTAVLDSEIDGL